MARGVELISQMALIENSIPWPYLSIDYNNAWYGSPEFPLTGNKLLLLQ